MTRLDRRRLENGVFLVQVMRNDDGPLPWPSEWRTKLETLKVAYPGQ